MKTPSFDRFSAIGIFLMAPVAAQAQNITLENVVANQSAGFPQLIFTQYGSTGPGAIPAYNFSFGVSSGTGAGAALVGGSYMGFCVNTFFADPMNGDTMLLDSTGDVLSYSVNGSADVWNIDTSVKFSALKDVLFANKDFFTNTDPASQAFADMSAAFSILSNEITIDYDGTLGSIDYASGNNTVTDPLGNPISGAVLANYNSLLTAVGTGSGAGFQLYAAAWPGLDPAGGTQDMVFFVVPEPSTLGLLPMAGFLALRRRRNPR